MTTYFISGPMTGKPNYNYDIFNGVEECLRQLGQGVINPAKNFDGDQSLDRRAYLARSTGQLFIADAVITLPGWEQSSGARAEVALAEAVGIPVHHDCITIEPLPTDDEPDGICEKALALVHGDRQRDYSPPDEDFKYLAQLWTAYLRRRYGIEVPELQASDIPMMMILLKVNREAHRHKEDNIVDIAGYAETAGMVYESLENPEW